MYTIILIYHGPTENFYKKKKLQNFISLLKQRALRKVQWHEGNHDNFQSVITSQYPTFMPIESNGKMKRINGHA